MPSASDRLWSGRFVLAMGIQFFSMSTFYMLLTTMALYAVDRFAASDAAAGFASSAFVVGSLMARLVTGKYIDFIGRRRLLVSVLLVFAIVGVLYLPVNELWLLFVVRIAHGMAFGAASTTLSSSVVSLIPVHRRGEGIGYYGLALTAASAAGPFVALWLVEHLGFQPLLIGAAITASSALLLALLLRLPERTPGPDEVARKWRMHPSEFVAVEVLPIALVMVLLTTSFSTVLAFINSFGRAEGLVGPVSVFFVFYAAALLLSRLTVGRLQDRRGDNAVFYPVLVLFAIGMAVLGLAINAPMVWAAALLIGFGYGSTLTAGQTVAVSVVPDHRMGVAVGTYLVGIDVGVALGPVLFGLVVPAVGFRGMYLLVTGLVVVIFVVYHLVHGRKRRGGRALELN